MVEELDQLGAVEFVDEVLAKLLGGLWWQGSHQFQGLIEILGCEDAKRTSKSVIDHIGINKLQLGVVFSQGRGQE